MANKICEGCSVGAAARGAGVVDTLVVVGSVVVIVDVVVVSAVVSVEDGTSFFRLALVT